LLLSGGGRRFSAADGNSAIVLKAHCIECHDAETKKGDLDLTTLAVTLLGSRSFLALGESP